MERHQISAFLQYPDAPLVQMAVSRANLNKDEWETIRLRELECLTIEAAAEHLDLSPGTVKNRYQSGMRKLQLCWSGIPWIESLGNGTCQ